MIFIGHLQLKILDFILSFGETIMSTADSIERVRDILRSSENIKFTEDVSVKCTQFMCEAESRYFRETFINQFKKIRGVTVDISIRGYACTVTVPFECTPIKLEDKFSPEEIKAKVKALKRVKPIAQSPVKRKFPKYTPGMSIDRYYTTYENLNRYNDLHLLPLNNPMSHPTSLYENNQTDFVFELVEDI